MNSFNFLTENTHRSSEFARGSQRKFRFPNGFGASVVKTVFNGFGGGTYGADEGLYELAVLAYEPEEESSLTYETPITSDVLGYLSAEEVEQTLDQIRALWIV